MDEDRFKPFTNMSWFMCSTCSTGVYENLIYKLLKSYPSDYEYFYNQEIYLETEEERKRKTD